MFKASLIDENPHYFLLIKQLSFKILEQNLRINLSILINTIDLHNNFLFKLNKRRRKTNNHKKKKRDLWIGYWRINQHHQYHVRFIYHLLLMFFFYCVQRRPSEFKIHKKKISLWPLFVFYISPQKKVKSQLYIHVLILLLI